MEDSALNKAIICAPMTRVSDANLAIAVDKAGGIGSIATPGHSLEWLEREIKQFISIRKHNNVLVSLSEISINEFKCKEICRLYKPKYVVLLNERTKSNQYVRSSLNNLGIRVICRIANLNDADIFPPPDYYTLKGSNSAGRFNKELSTLEFLKKFKDRYPDLKAICTGGLYNRDDIHECFEQGASAVEVGTPFAVSKESSINIDTKLSMLNNPSIKIMNNTGYDRRVHSPNSEYDLSQGVAGNLDKGHVYIGAKISELPKKIRSTQEIMNELLPLG